MTPLDRINAWRLLLATAGAAMLIWDARSRRGPGHERSGRLRDGILAALGLLGLFAWWNFGVFGWHVHRWDFTHYYLGAKYFPETGYTRLYATVAAAEADMGDRDAVARRRLRNLETGRPMWGTDVLRDLDAYRGRFSAERWSSFQHDVAFLKSRTDPGRWKTAQLDHGYNATPVWGIAGTLLTNLGPATDRQLLALSLLDPILYAVMWAVVCATFGWRSASVAALYWGTNYPGQFAWTGGSLLRADWLVAMVIGVCLLARRRMAAGGFALMTSALLRVFPGLLLVGLALRAGVEVVRARRIPADFRRAALGSLAAALLLVPLSTLVAGGGRPRPGAWPEFVENSRKYFGGPAANFVGLKAGLSWIPGRPVIRAEEDDPAHDWWEEVQRAYRGRRWIWGVLAAASLLATTRAAGRHDAWVAAVLGAALIPVLLSLSCYYYAFLLVFGFLWEKHPQVGAALVALSALTGAVSFLGAWEFEVYAVISILVTVFALWVALLMGRSPASAAGASTATAGV